MNKNVTKRRRKTPAAAKSKLIALGLSESQLKKSHPKKLPPLTSGRMTGGGNGDTWAYGLPRNTQELPSIQESLKNINETLNYFVFKKDIKPSQTCFLSWIKQLFSRSSK